MTTRERITLFLIFCAALAVRLWFLARVQSDPSFHIPVFDPKEFNFWAFQIMHNHWQWLSLQNHTPLYAYFLAVIYKIFGYNLNIVSIIQSILGALGTCFMYVYMKRFVNTFAATLCAGLMAGYWWFVYTQLYLFSENLAMFLNIVLVCHLTFARDSARKFLGAGILLGLSTLCRPEVLVFGLLILWWMWGEIQDRRRCLFFYGIFLSGFLLVLAPVLVRNHQLCGSWLLRSQIGANAFIGNRPELMGTNVFLEQGRRWQKFMALPYTEMRPGRLLRESEINAFYFRKTVSYIRQHPYRWLTFMFRKTFTIVTGREFLRSEDVYFRDLFVLNTPFVLISTQCLFVLALAGLFLSWGQRKEWKLAGIFLLSLVPTLFFSAKTRYWVPAMPLVLVFSSLGAAHLYQAFREKDATVKKSVFALVLALGLLSFLNPLYLREPDFSETHYAIASNLQYQGNYSLAEKYFQSALVQNPLNCSAWADLGVLYVTLGRYYQAQYCFGRARDIDEAYQPYYVLARDMADSDELTVKPDRVFRLPDQDNPVIKKYLEHFHYP